MANSRLFLVFAVVVALCALITSSSVDVETPLSEENQSNVTLSPVEDPIESREVDILLSTLNSSFVEDLLENKQGPVSSSQLGLLTNIRKTLSSLVRRRPSRLPSAAPVPGAAPGSFNPAPAPPGYFNSAQPTAYNTDQQQQQQPGNVPNSAPSQQVAPYPPANQGQQGQVAFFSVPTVGDNFQFLSPGPNDPPLQPTQQQSVQPQLIPQSVQQPAQSQLIPQSVQQPFQQNPFLQLSVQQPLYNQQQQFVPQQQFQQQQYGQQPQYQQVQNGQPLQSNQGFQQFQSAFSPAPTPFQPVQQQQQPQLQSAPTSFQFTIQPPFHNQYSNSQPLIQQPIRPQFINSKPPQEATQAITVYSEPEPPEPPKRPVVVGTAYVTQTSTLIATAYVTRLVTVTTENRITTTVIGTHFRTVTATVTTENRFCKFIIPTTIPTIIQPSYVTPYATNNYIKPTRLPQYY